MSYRNDGFAVRISVPGLLVDLEAAFGGKKPYEGWHFAGQVVYFVSILSTGVLPAEEGVVVEGFILQDFYALTTAGVVLGRLGYAK